MEINFGRYTGKSSEVVVLKHGAYAKWVLEQTNAGSGLGHLQADLERLIVKFDAKPLSKVCHHCTSRATLVTGYWNNDSVLYPWCNKCDPYLAGAHEGKLVKLRTYRDALRHVELACGGTQAGYDRVVRAFAEAKGLPARVGEAAAKAFFS
ncbi:hypothetical protein [Burkholderia sp. 3C]